VPDAELAAAAEAITARLAAGPPGSYAATKRLINDRLYAGLEKQLDAVAVLQQRCAESADFAEGIHAFTQKRPATFIGA
jgi:enoyl-CoA hydratase/carnithine racemase